MELGAVVCTATNAKCEACPLRKDCASFRLGIQNEIPVLPKRAASVDVREAAIMVRRKDRVLLVQRPATGRWAGLWEFPHGQLENGETLESAATRIMWQFAAFRVRLGAEVFTVRHAVTYHRITLTCFEATYLSGAFRSKFYARGEWVELARLGEYPVSSPQRRLAAALNSSERQHLLF
jgi:A/G-specific adenine glycosylase